MNLATHPDAPTQPQMAERISAAIEAFNSDPKRSFDDVDGDKVYHRARLPILATDCDYEIVSISGVQGRRLAA